MPWLLDTTWVVDYLLGRPEAIRLLEQLVPGSMFISIVSYMEVYEGVISRPNPDAGVAQLQKFLEAVPVLAFSAAVARRCAELRKVLRERARRVNARALDLIIAATAIEHGLVLLTHNTEDFNDIPGLTVAEPTQRP